MTMTETQNRVVGRIDASFSDAELEEMAAMGLVDGVGAILAREPVVPQVARRKISALDVLNEAPDYASGFTRGLSMNEAATAVVARAA